MYNSGLPHKGKTDFFLKVREFCIKSVDTLRLSQNSYLYLQRTRPLGEIPHPRPEGPDFRGDVPGVVVTARIEPYTIIHE